MKCISHHVILLILRIKDNSRVYKFFHELVTRYDISVDQFFSQINQRKKIHNVGSLIHCLIV